MQKQTLGQKIAELRKANNLTQLELAEKLNITDKAVSKWERDISCPDINTFPKLAEILGVSVDELLQSSQINKSEDSKKDIVDIILKGVPLAMGIAVIVLTVMGQLYWEDAAGLLGVGLLSIAIRAFREK